MNRQNLVIYAVGLIILALYIYYSYLNVELGVKNVAYFKLHQELVIMKKKNTQLREEVLIRQSLQDIQRRAKEQGFYPALRYLTIP